MTTFIKYATVGAVGTLIDVGVFTLLVATTPLGDTYEGRIAAASCSFLLAVVNNYIGNRAWTFRNTDRRVGAQFTKFFLVSCIGLVLNAAALTLVSWLISTVVMPSTATHAASKLVASGVVLLYNYFANSRWTFRA